MATQLLIYVLSWFRLHFLLVVIFWTFTKNFSNLRQCDCFWYLLSFFFLISNKLMIAEFSITIKVAYSGLNELDFTFSCLDFDSFICIL